VIAIDGPAGAGKSTLSRKLAGRLGVSRLDTGAMYRSVAWAALERGIDPADAPAVAELARSLVITVDDRVSVDGTDVTRAIRDPEVNVAVSVVSAHPDVRAVLVARQRQWVADQGGGVVEGRDIGSVVLPDADLKIFLTASPEERARRRADEGADGVARRDRLDQSRAASPLEVAPGARVVDTSDRTADEVVDEVLAWL
jgi:cytidylate kinase